jgi:hypothetical protein
MLRISMKKPKEAGAKGVKQFGVRRKELKADGRGMRETVISNL